MKSIALTAGIVGAIVGAVVGGLMASQLADPGTGPDELNEMTSRLDELESAHRELRGRVSTVEPRRVKAETDPLAIENETRLAILENRLAATEQQIAEQIAELKVDIDAIKGGPQ